MKGGWWGGQNTESGYRSCTSEVRVWPLGKEKSMYKPLKQKGMGSLEQEKEFGGGFFIRSRYLC